PGGAADRRLPGRTGARRRGDRRPGCRRGGRRRRPRRRLMAAAPGQHVVTRPAADALVREQAEERQQIKLLSANIQAGSSTRRYSDYAMRSWSHVLPAGGKRQALDQIAELAGGHDIVGLQESDPGSWRSGFTNQTHYLAERG